MSLRDTLSEIRDLGVRRTLFRATWEARMRSGAMSALAPREPRFDVRWVDAARVRALPFAAPEAVAAAISLDESARAELVRMAEDAIRGRLVCFSRWTADFGEPIDWHRDPLDGTRWPHTEHWSRSSLHLGDADIKIVWEAGRFPQAYTFARAAVHHPAGASRYAAALLAQIDSFIAANPFGRGVHWASGYEIALRSFSWLFALHVFSRLGLWDDAAQQRVLAALHANAVHVAAFFDFARLSCFNDHLIGEALLLSIAGMLFPGSSDAAKWRAEGRRVLDEQAETQIFSDGAYLLASHVYQRAVVQMYVLGAALLRAEGETLPDQWRAALDRSIEFLSAQQNPADGWLPNAGSNDGGVPFLGSSTSYNDFRPVLQSASAAARDERLYARGEWDEEAVWLNGESSLTLPLRAAERRSRSFSPTGYHVLQGNEPSSFGVFRCGAIRNRFPQIDMLHLDVWWRGINVLADGGTYRYNGAPEWHEHFHRTASHNTVTVDGTDQMLHYRQFKVLHWTDARLLSFARSESFDIIAGEHYGYGRIADGCVHRRSILFSRDDLWIVVDRITGEGSHDLRLHWLAGHPDFRRNGRNGMILDTGKGEFHVAVYDQAATPLNVTVAAGEHPPPRGWLSRYYGEKLAVPSLVAEMRVALPAVAVSILSAGAAEVSVSADQWTVTAAGRELRFALRDGEIGQVA